MNSVTKTTLPTEQYHVDRFFDLSTDMFCIAGFDGYFRKVNAAFERTLGYTNEELSHISYFSLIHPDDVAATTGIVKQHNATREAVVRYDCRFRCKDGSYRWLSFAATPPENDLIYASCRDITEQKEMVEKLRASEAQYRQIVESTTEGVMMLDLTGKVTFVNQRTLEMFGYTRDEMMGKVASEFLQPQEAQKSNIYNLDITRPYQNEVCFVRKDNTEFWVMNNSTPIHDTTGKQIGVLGLLADITQRRRDRLEMQSQNESLVKANRELAVARRNAEEGTRLKSEFLATMSHELRTPLNAIIGYTEIQLAGMTGDLNDEQRDYQMRTLVNAENLLRLINDVLDLAKIEARRISLSEKPFLLVDVIKSVIYQTKGLAESKELPLQYKIDPAMPETLVGDYVRIKQMLVNLVSNAIKFTDSGLIEIRVERESETNWVMHVSDTGVGIPAHAQEYIFDEFRQVDGTSQRRYGGTGLGLAIVRQLTTMMGGTIRLKSRVGEGSTFSITLPFIHEPVAAT